MEKINRLIENKIKIGNIKKYTAIIGETPSIGARSPKLWNSLEVRSQPPIKRKL